MPGCRRAAGSRDRLEPGLSINKKNGATLELRGETMHTPCGDGVTPCRFLGYRFRNGKTHYFVWEDGDGEKGTLEVRTDRQVLLTERGTWK